MSKQRAKTAKMNGSSSSDIQMTVDDGMYGASSGTQSEKGSVRMKKSTSLQSLNIFKNGSLSKVFGRRGRMRFASNSSQSLDLQDNVAYDVETMQPPSPPSVSGMALGMEREGQDGPSYWEIPREKLVVGNLKQRGRFGELYFGKVSVGNRTLSADIKKQKGKK